MIRSEILYYLAKFLKLARLPAIKKSEISPRAKICSGSHVVNSTILSYSYVGHNCLLLNTSMNRFCSVADGVLIGGASHPIDWVSSSPVFANGRNVLKINFATHEYNPSARTEVGADVWIGNNALIKAGVSIGHGAVVGMGSVVTKSIPNYEVWAGNPARFIRKRFDDETIKKLLELEWWEIEDSELIQIARYFNDVDLFLKKCTHLLAK